jgi:hypothetical protein
MRSGLLPKKGAWHKRLYNVILIPWPTVPPGWIQYSKSTIRPFTS